MTEVLKVKKRAKKFRIVNEQGTLAREGTRVMDDGGFTRECDAREFLSNLRKKKDFAKRAEGAWWAQRSSAGRKPKFKDAQHLLECCQEYFIHVEDHPLIESKPHVVSGDIEYSKTEHTRVMTMGALFIFLDITNQTWLNYKEKDEFFEVTVYVEGIIRHQKFSGAASGMFKENIIARDLGLKDATHTELTGKDGGAVKTKAEATVITANLDEKQATDLYLGMLDESILKES